MYRIQIIIPIYNDNISLSKILNEIDKIKSEKYIFNITLIDDFSEKPIFDSLSFNFYKNINSIKILRLHTNMGHQKAISIGLYDAINGNSKFILVMDGDGEDSPNNIINLLDVALEKKCIVVASRKRRYESVFFKIFYFLYCLSFFLSTGLRMNFGNFSVIPCVFLKDIFNHKSCEIHYPATILKSGIKLEYVPLDRCKRYQGSSKMNFLSLVLHGFKSFVIFKQKITLRLIILYSLSIFFLISTEFLIPFLLLNIPVLFLLLIQDPKPLDYKNIDFSKLLLK